MNMFSKNGVRLFGGGLVALVVSAAVAASLTLDDTLITFVAVNGGSDSMNPGTTCIRVSSEVPAACAGGFLYIPNNNKQLIATALAANATKARTWIYFLSDVQTGHCPGQVFTTCSVISIGVK